LDAAPSSQEWLVVKEFWVNLLNTVSRFMVKNPATIYATVEEQMEALSSEIDLESLARKASTAPLLSLLEVVLACSMQCKLKENCIMQVMQLRKDQQQAMMASIQNVMAKHQKRRSSSSKVPLSSSSSSSSTSSASSSSVSQQDIDYKERYLTLKQNKDTIASNLSRVQTEKDALADENAHLLTLISHLESQVSSLSTECKQQKVQLDDLAEKQQLSAEQVDLSSPIRFSASSKISSEENARLRSTIAAHEKTIASQQQQLSVLSSYVSKVRELEDEVEMLKEKSHSAEQLERLSRKFEAKSTELSTALLKVKQLEEQLESVSKVSSEHETVAKQVPTLRAKLDQYKSELVSLHSKLTDASMSQGSRNSEFEELKQRIQLHELQAEQHASIVASLEKEKQELMEALRSRPVVQSKTSQTMATLDSSSTAAVSSTTIKKQSLAAEARSTLKTVSKIDQHQANQLEKDLTAAKEEIETVKMDLEDKLDTMVRLKEKFQADYIASSESLRVLQETLISTQTELVRTSADRDELSRQNETLKTQNSECQLAIEDLTSQKLKLEFQFAQTEKELNRIVEEHTVLIKQTETLAGQNSERQITIDDLTSQKHKLTSQIAQLEKEISRITEENANLLKQTESLAIESSDRQVSIDELSLQKQKLEAQISHIENEMTKIKASTSAKESLLEDELTEARLKMESLASDLSLQQDQTQAVVSELDDAKHAKSELQSELANMEMEYKTLEETLQEFMDRELEVVESSLSLKNEVQNLTAIVESRDAELTVMQKELEKAKANEDLISIISTLRTQVISQQKQIVTAKEEQKAIVASYHSMGMELLQLKMGGLPKPSTRKSVFSFTPSDSSVTPTKGSTPKRVPLRERSVNQMATMVAPPAGPCTETSGKTRRMTMAQKALETRPRVSLASSALAKR
jgi:chromosome segregation ATPase